MAEIGDLAAFLKNKYHNSLYKKAGATLNTLGNRVKKMNKHRRSNRHEAIFEKRRIPENMSPAVTPLQSPGTKRRKTLSRPEPQPQPVNKRFEMMLKWRAEKQKQKEAQKKELKPIFKVSRVCVNVGLPNLETVNKEIKGKPFKSKFAPPNHQFKPPSNIKPIFFHNSKVTQKKEAPSTPHRMVTRSQVRVNSSSVVSDKKSEIKSTKTAKPKSTQKRTKKNESDNKLTQSMNSLNQSKVISDEKKETLPQSVEKTPPSNPPVYLSPFVTVSRGKNSARKEYEGRKSGKLVPVKPDQDACSSPKAGAAYFRWLLDNQIFRLQGLCDEWLKYKNDLNPPEEAVCMIDVAIGQTNLLLTKKFMQFQGLIDNCQEGNAETLVTCEDLHGFWDMMHIQIDNLDKRFENLNNLKANNWEEILPEIKKVVVKKKGKAVKNVKASAGLRAAIEAARKKKLHDSEEAQDERKTPKKRNSCRLSTLKSLDKSQTKTSPGLTMMKVAQYAKGFETPSKSILKTETSKSAKSQTKTVLFQDEVKANIDNVGNIENDLNQCNSETKAKTPSRRSGRVTRSKLF